jgi:hypothetical protein
MVVPYISASEEQKKRTEELEKENEFLKSRLKQYGWDASKETPFAKKSEAEKLAEIIRVFATCYLDDGKIDYSKAVKVFSSYQSDELPKTEEECKKFDARMMRGLYHRICGCDYVEEKYFPTISGDDLESKVYPALRLRFEKNPKKLILKKDLLPPEKVELHGILCELYDVEAEFKSRYEKEPTPGDEVAISIQGNPTSIQYQVSPKDYEESEKLFQDWYIGLSLDDMKMLFEPEEVPEEFLKEGKYRCNYKIIPIPKEEEEE